MKNTLLFYSCALALLISSQSYAELNESDYASQVALIGKNQQQPQECEGPFAVSFNVDATGKADFDNDHCQERLDDVRFTKAQGAASVVFYYKKECKEALVATAYYTYTQIKWKNPFFKQNDFDTVSLAIAGTTGRLCRWTWDASVTVNADIRHFKWRDYLTFDLLLGGRYAYSENFGVHFGFIALTGMKIDHVYPILGIDWTINSQWQLNLIYPYNLALIYNFTPNWSFDIAGRTWDERHRVGPHNHDSRGLVEYLASGIEIGANFHTCDKALKANVHVGELLGGRVKTSNRFHKHIHRFKFKNAPYVGGQLDWRF